MLMATWVLALFSAAQFGITRTTAKRQVRAYVSVDATLIDGTLVNPPQLWRKDWPGILIVMKNTGQTPAYRATSWAQIDVIPDRRGVEAVNRGQERR
jgi:hypothetical protein